MNKFYKVQAVMNEIERTFIIHVCEESTIETLTERLSELLLGWYIYNYREIEYRDLEIVTYW